MRDEFDRGREVDVAADVVVVGVGVDDAHHRLRGDLLDLGDERLTPSRDLRVDEGDAVGADEDRRVAAASPEEEEIVLEFFDLDDLGACASGASLCACALVGGDGRRDPAGEQEAKYDDPSVVTCHVGEWS